MAHCWDGNRHAGVCLQLSHGVQILGSARVAGRDYAGKRGRRLGVVLGISEATVHAHLATIYKQLRVHDRESAVRLFMGHFPGGVKWPPRPLGGLDLF